METMMRETMTHRFTNESPINGLCDICGSSVQFHNQPSDHAESGQRDLSNFRVEYIAPTKPEHTFEPRCAILADSDRYGTVRAFDVPDPDESQREAAVFACQAMNGFDGLVAALEQARKMNQYVVELSDQARIDNARTQARQAMIVIDEALAAVRRDS